MIAGFAQGLGEAQKLAQAREQLEIQKLYYAAQMQEATAKVKKMDIETQLMQQQLGLRKGPNPFEDIPASPLQNATRASGVPFLPGQGPSPWGGQVPAPAQSPATLASAHGDRMVQQQGGTPMAPPPPQQGPFEAIPTQPGRPHPLAAGISDQAKPMLAQLWKLDPEKAMTAALGQQNNPKPVDTENRISTGVFRQPFNRLNGTVTEEEVQRAKEQGYDIKVGMDRAAAANIMVREEKMRTSEVQGTARPLGPEYAQKIESLRSMLRVTDALMTEFTPEERAKYSGFFDYPASKVLQLRKEDPKFNRFSVLVSEEGVAAFEIGGKQFTQNEAKIVFGFLPTGKEWVPGLFEAKLKEAIPYAQSKLNDVLTIATTPAKELRGELDKTAQYGKTPYKTAPRSITTMPTEDRKSIRDNLGNLSPEEESQVKTLWGEGKSGLDITSTIAQGRTQRLMGELAPQQRNVAPGFASQPPMQAVPGMQPTTPMQPMAPPQPMQLPSALQPPQPMVPPQPVQPPQPQAPMRPVAPRQQVQRGEAMAAVPPEPTASIHDYAQARKRINSLGLVRDVNDYIDEFKAGAVSENGLRRNLNQLLTANGVGNAGERAQIIDIYVEDATRRKKQSGKAR